MEPIERIERSNPDWKSGVLPLNYIGMAGKNGIEPLTYWLLLEFTESNCIIPLTPTASCSTSELFSNTFILYPNINYLSSEKVFA